MADAERSLHEVRHLARTHTAKRAARATRLRVATRAWTRLPRRDKLLLVQEVVETRGAELRRACTGVMSVGYGHVTRRVRGRRRVLDVPCVKFFVQQKWDPPAGQSREGEIPRYLLAYYPVRGRRLLCAVPSDVEAAGGLRAQFEDPGVRVAGVEKGAVAAVVRLPGEPDDRYLLSCRHVFGLTRTIGSALPPASDVTRIADSTTIARTVAMYGVLVPGERVSFDAALARVVDLPPTLQDRLPTLSYLDALGGLDEIRLGDEYEIWTPDGTKRAVCTGKLPFPPDITYDGLEGPIRMAVALLQSEVGVGTAPGDSGSPVVTLDGRRLLGMHVAGVGTVGMMIPAFELLRTSNYVGLAAGKRLVLTTGR